MVQSLHRNGMRIVLDVVYNHTASVEHSNFNLTVPGYFYRQNADGSYSDASGCGNETASEREMVRHYIVESVKFWAQEYHIDGFRFDLMGIHDIETMNRIREELSKIDPTIFIYGEGWLAADSPLPPEKRAVRDHVGQMEGIAVFCDDFRDAVRGSTFDEQAAGYASGNIVGHYEPVKFGIAGATQHPQVDYNGLLYSSVPYASAPSQAVNFVASHDGYTVIDKLRLSVTGNRAEEELLPIDKLIHTILLTAQGVPFIRAGEEMMQDKQGEPNSFRSPDAVNQIDWALKAEHRGLFDYIRQLIALRKAHPAFRIPTAEGLRQGLRFLDTGDSGVIAYTLGEHANGDAWKEILVAYNGNRHPAEFRIPEAERIVVCRDGRIDPDSRERLSGEASSGWPPLRRLSHIANNFPGSSSSRVQILYYIDCQPKLKNLCISYGIYHRLGGRMDRQPDFQGQRLRIAGQSDRRPVGGILGGWLVSLFGWVPTGTWGTFLASIIGAIVLLWIVSLFTRHKPAKTM